MVWLKYSQRRLGLQSGLQGGHQVGLQGGPQQVLQGVLYGVESFQMDSGRGNMGQNGQGGGFSRSLKGVHDTSR